MHSSNNAHFQLTAEISSKYLGKKAIKFTWLLHTTHKHNHTHAYAHPVRDTLPQRTALTLDLSACMCISIFALTCLRCVAFRCILAPIFEFGVSATLLRLEFQKVTKNCYRCLRCDRVRGLIMIATFLCLCRGYYKFVKERCLMYI